MPIHFQCPHCGIESDFHEKCAGHTGPCAACGEVMTIPCPEGVEPPSQGPRAAVLAVILLVGLLGAGIGVLLMSGGSPAKRDAAAQRAGCASHMQKIAAAMHAYVAANGCFPPAYVVDGRGKRLYSWRALLLPYLDKDLAKQFHYDQAWNSPENNLVSNLTMGLFQCPAQQPAPREPTTNYMMVVGPKTISDGTHGCKMADILDGPANTIMLVEVADSDIWWAEPEDLSFDQISFKINNSKRIGISSYHPDGINVAFCAAAEGKDAGGVVRFLKDGLNPQLVKAMLTINGAEKVPAGR